MYKSIKAYFLILLASCAVPSLNSNTKSREVSKEDKMVLTANEPVNVIDNNYDIVNDSQGSYEESDTKVKQDKRRVEQNFNEEIDYDTSTVDVPKGVVEFFENGSRGIADIGIENINTRGNVHVRYEPKNVYQDNRKFVEEDVNTEISTTTTVGLIKLF